MFEDQMVEMLPARTTMSQCSPCGGGGKSRSGGGFTAIDSGNGNGNGNGSVGLVNGSLNGNTIVVL